VENKEKIRVSSSFILPLQRRDPHLNPPPPRSGGGGYRRGRGKY